MNKTIAFAISTKDRGEFTRRTVKGLDCSENLDIFWFDGSATEDGRRVPSNSYFERSRLKEIHYAVTGGPDAAIVTALKRMLSLGYPYVGLLENDIQLEEGWLEACLSAIWAAQCDGFRVGAATVRTIESRVLFHRPLYGLMWNMGAGMVLFTREGAEAVLSDYKKTHALEMARFYAEVGFDLRGVWELWMDRPDRPLGADWFYAPAMLKSGLVSVGSIPPLAKNIDVDLEVFCRSEYSRVSRAHETDQQDRFNHFQSQYFHLWHQHSRGHS